MQSLGAIRFDARRRRAVGGGISCRLVPGVPCAGTAAKRTERNSGIEGYDAVRWVTFERSQDAWRGHDAGKPQWESQSHLSAAGAEHHRAQPIVSGAAILSFMFGAFSTVVSRVRLNSGFRFIACNDAREGLMVTLRSLSPPFTHRSAIARVRLAEDAWNSRDPIKVTKAYSVDSRWRNRSEFLQGHLAIEAFLTRKWNLEHEYRLIKELWAYTDARIAVRFVYEWHDDGGTWFRSHGNENWEFAKDGLMKRREASINDIRITAADRRFEWPLGPRPKGHLGLTDLGL